jgi:hypothetical protein
MRLVILMVLAGLVASPLSASAQAETDSVVVSPRQLEVARRSELQSRLADLEAAYQDANVRKPRVGIAVSVMVMAGGVMAVVAGAVFNSGLGSPPTERDQRVGSALIGVGSITIAAGAGGLAFSGFRLKRAKRERERLEPEIKSLRSTLDR